MPDTPEVFQFQPRGIGTAVDALTVRRNSIWANHQAVALLAVLRAPFAEGAVVAILPDPDGTLTSDPARVAEAMGMVRVPCPDGKPHWGHAVCHCNSHGFTFALPAEEQP